MTLLTDLEDFVRDHRKHGQLSGDATQPTEKGYLVILACPCGVVFERWVTQVDATVDLFLAELRAGRN